MPTRSQSTDPQDSCLQRAMDLLSRAPHSTADLRRKLRQRKFDGGTVQTTIEELERLKLLDDRVVARDYCAFKRDGHPPIGRARIMAELKRHGIPSPIIQEVLADVWDADGDAGERERAIAVARLKRRALRPDEDPRKQQAKLYRFLASRGFPAAICRDAVDAVDAVRADEDG